MAARDESAELILQMYKYSAAIAALVGSGQLTREGLGKSIVTQWMVTTPL